MTAGPRIIARTPDACQAERRYALETVLGRHLGIAVDVTVEPGRTTTELTMPDLPGTVELAESLLLSQELWGADSLLPAQAGTAPAASGSEGTVIDLFGQATGSALTVADGRASIAVDLLGTAFALLSGYEEIVRPTTRDSDDRFPGSESVLARSGLVTRPVVDELTELLWTALEALWPRLARTQHTFTVTPTHDVDKPWAYASRRPLDMLRTAVGAGKRLGPKAALDMSVSAAKVVRHGLSHDPYDTFDQAMDVAERTNRTAEFYFIGDSTPVGRDVRCLYAMDDPAVRELVERIGARGHKVGMHGSYVAHRDGAQLTTELGRIRQACEAVGHGQASYGGRFHYLRWDAATSPAALAEAGVSYDSTVGFAEVSGFRAGTCRSYQLWDHRSRQATTVIERPLVWMDATPLWYQGQRSTDARVGRDLSELKAVTRTYGGDLVVLFHNDQLFDQVLLEHLEDICL